MVRISDRGSDIEKGCIMMGILPLVTMWVVVILFIFPYAVKAGNPSSRAESAWQRGFDMYRKRQYSAAIKEFDAAIVENPRYPRGWNGKGICLAFMGKQDEGLKCIDKALDLDPAYENAHFNKALALELSHRWDEAIVSFDNAIRIIPGNPWSHYGKACSYGMLGDANRAADSLRKAIGLDPATRISARTEKDLSKIREKPVIRKLLWDSK